MNLSILLCVQAALSRIHLPSILCALLIMCINTLVCHLLSPPHWSGLIVQGVVCILCAKIVIRSSSIRHTLIAASAILCTTASAAGFSALLHGNLFSAMLGPVPLCILMRRRRNALRCWNITIIAEKHGITERFRALIDTGNHLTEHRSALPVIIAEQKSIPALTGLMSTLEPSEIRTLGFGVLGSTGEIQCFRPDRLAIQLPDGSITPAPQCWIAPFVGCIPGRTAALAPPEFAEYISNRSVPHSAVSKIIRRFSYAFFNR